MEKLSQETLDFLRYRNAAGMIWLESEEGIKFLNSSKALSWLLSEDGSTWLNQHGDVWLQRDDCMMINHLVSEEGISLLENPSLRRWLTETGKGEYWLQTGHGVNWLRSEDGQAWLRSDAGKRWLNVPKELLSET